jgi:ankyrin repeat protein
MRSNLIGLIEHGAKLNIVDSDGRDPIMHAIMKNNTMVVTILLENKRALQINQNC